MEKEFMSLEELREYLMDKPAVATVYNWVYKKRIPFTKFGKKLFFDKEKIKIWNQNGRQWMEVKRKKNE